MKHFSTDPKFEDVHGRYEFWPLVAIALVLADHVGRTLRKCYPAAPRQLSREQDTLRQTATVAPGEIARKRWLAGGISGGRND